MKKALHFKAFLFILIERVDTMVFTPCSTTLGPKDHKEVYSMKKYEIMYILKANLEEAVRQETIDGLHAIITSNNGTIDNVDEWGLKEFAYEINDEKKGYYVVVKVTANNEGIQEFDRLARINQNVVRFLIVKEEA